MWRRTACPPDARSILARLEAEGHEVALRVSQVPPAWQAAPEALRVGLAEAAQALAEALAAAGWQGTLPRFWRPGAVPDVLRLGQTAEAERPLVLWSVRGELPLASVLPRLGGGDILALPGDGVGCPAVALMADLGRALTAAGLTAVPAGVLLEPQLARHHPPQALRYFGRGLPTACSTPLGLPAEADVEGERARWGLLDGAVGDTVRVLPLAGVGDTTAELLAGPAWALWDQRVRWQAMPGCLRRVPLRQLLAPITSERPGGQVRWWTVGEEGMVERDPRATGAPGGATTLPAVPDLVRLEARQRLPWPLRGLVADALERLGLDTPLLVEARSAPAMVLSHALEPGASLTEIDAALGAFVQVVELSLAEYVFLGMHDPADLAALLRVARAGDGFLRPGPFLVLRRGGLPDGRHLGPDGLGFPEAPAALVQQALAVVGRLEAGDVLAAAPAPLLGAPRVGMPPDTLSRRARLRHGLARSILAGSSRADYLRPGSVVRVEGDLLGQQEVRLAVPAGVAVPSLDAGPLRPSLPPAGATP